jgi:hypothetical protein
MIPVHPEFTAVPDLDEGFENDLAGYAASMLLVPKDELVAGNSHNTVEIGFLMNAVAKTSYADTLVCSIDGDCSLSLHVWQGFAYVICDDLIGVFCSRAAAAALMAHRWPTLSDGTLWGAPAAALTPQVIDWLQEQRVAGNIKDFDTDDSDVD